MTSTRADGATTSSSTAMSPPSGVVSMLKTTTEMGDAGQLSSSNRFQKPSRINRFNGQTPSRTSSHYSQRTGSIKSRVSNESFREPGNLGNGPYHASRAYLPGPPGLHRQGAFNRSQEFYSSNSIDRPPDVPGSFRSFTMGGPSADRSYSFTRAGPPPANTLAAQRSIQNLRNNSQLPRPRSPYSYNSPRHLHPLHRGPSPALSDHTVPGSKIPALRPNLGPRSYTSLAPQRSDHVNPYQTYHHDSQYAGRSGPQPTRFTGTPRWPRQYNQQNGKVPYSRLHTPQARVSPSVLEIPATPKTLAPVPVRLEPPATFDGHFEASEQIPPQNPLRDSTPHAGFVQKVKSALESHMPSNTATKQAATPQTRPVDELSLDAPASEDLKHGLDEKIPNKLTRDLIKAGVEPSSEVTSEPTPEEAGIKRLTREFIKAAVGESEDLKHKDSQDTFDIVVFGSETVKSSFDERSILAGYAGAPNSFEGSVVKDEARQAETLAEAESFNASVTEYSNTTSTTAPNSTAEKESDGSDSKGDTALEIESTNHQVSSCHSADTVEQKDSGPDLTSPFRPKSLPFGMKHLLPSFGSWNQHQVTQSYPSAGDSRLPKGDPPKSTAPESEEAEHGNHASRLSVLDGFLPDAATPRSTVTESIKPLKQAESPLEVQKDQDQRDSLAFGSESHYSDTRHHSIDALRTSFASTNDSRRTSIYYPVDARHSVIRNFNAPLPDLAEDSQESASTTNLRILGAGPPTFRHLGHRNRPEPERTSRVFVPPKLAESYLRRSLAAIGKLPSLKFSHTDLTTKLNLALGMRASRSLEDLAATIPSVRTSKWLEDRAASADMLHYRYASFFLKAESLHEGLDDLEVRTLSKKSSIDIVETKDSEILQEINRLSIPSVDLLSVRLSEFLPTFKPLSRVIDSVEYSTRGLEDEDDDGLEESSVASQDDGQHKPRSSQQNLMLANKEARKLLKMRLNQELPPLTNDIIKLATYRSRVLELSKRPSADEARRIVTSRKENINELKSIARKPDTFAGRSRPTKLQPAVSTISGSMLNNHDMLRRGTAATSLDIDVGQRRARLLKSPKTNMLRKTRSDAQMATEHTIQIARTMSPMPRFNARLIPEASRRVASKVAPVASKDSLLESLSKKMGLKSRSPEPAGFPVDPAFLHGIERSSAVDPGDRYPTTSLTSPIGLLLDENRSFFSDDSSLAPSEKEYRASLRKRLTRLRPKRSSNRQIESDDTRSEGNTLPVPLSRLESSSASMTANANTTNTNRTTELMVDGRDETPPGGVGKFEFHARRTFERLRSWTLRCSEVLHFNMGKKRKPPSWYDHGDDSLVYSGV